MTASAPTQGHAESQPVGFQELRTRVSFFLPRRSIQEEQAVRSVIAYLQTQLNGDPPVTGFTHSSFPMTVFSGFWWNDDRAEWQRERVILFTVDYDVDLEDRRLAAALGRLYRVIQRRYERYGSPQQVVWIITNGVVRFGSEIGDVPDPEGAPKAPETGPQTATDPPQGD